MVQKAKQLGIPPGPLYSQLKNGKSVSFEKNGEHVTVDPSQVLEGGSDGVAVALIYCPSIEILLQLRDTENKALKSLNAYKQRNTSQNKADNLVKLEVMIHLTPKSIFDSQDYQNIIDNTKYIHELNKKYEKENKDMKKELIDMQNEKNINDRKVVYETNEVDKLKIYNYQLVLLYWTIVLVFLITFFFKNMFMEKKNLIVVAVILLFPFIIHWMVYIFNNTLYFHTFNRITY